ncbi:MAG: trypsin-like peptidase domain-containing protein [Deltaproteobacteria bacterium]|nr:trypsin-like peptidase domain-containing protein [Deltaproteobacteria bacterium]
MTQRSMGSSMVIAILVLFIAGCPPKDNGRNAPTSPIFQRAKSQVFLIGSNEGSYSGTAFVISYKDKPYLISNYHVIEELKKTDLFIENEAGVKYSKIEVLGTDRAADLSVMKVEGLPKDVKPLEYSMKYATSQRIYVVGFPAMRSEEEHLNFNPGSISDAHYLSRVYKGTGDMRYIQVTADINSGNSGSPILNDRTEVIGVAAWRFLPESDIAGGNYAVPFEMVSNLIENTLARNKPAEEHYPLGATCANDSQCEWIYHCIDGTCQHLHDAGMPCKGDLDCYYPYLCYKDICTKMGMEGDFCENDSQCMAKFYCILNACREPGKVGDPCTSFQHCEAPLACTANKCTECSVGGSSSQHGAACCDDSNCTPPLYCIINQCVPLGGGGDPCAVDMDCNSNICEKGACQGGGMSIGSLGGMNASCSSDGECSSPYYCVVGQCRPLSDQGDPCSYDGDCVSPLICKAGVCGNLGAVGTPCKSFMECQTGLGCLNSTCSNCTITGQSSTLGNPCCDDGNCASPMYCILGQCTPMGGAGCPCGVSQDCDSSDCQNGKCVGGGACWQTQKGKGEACAYTDECMPPLNCVMGSCKGLGVLGEPCNKDGDCEVPFICIASKCKNMGQSGDPCKSFSHCTSPLACINDVCTTCSISGSSAVMGNPCCDDSNCTGGLYCILGTCRAMANISEPCGVDMDCNSNNCIGNMCQPLGVSGPPVSSACKSDSDCMSPLKCIIDKCQELGPAGAVCQVAADCKAGVCKKGKCVGGETCTADLDCKSKDTPHCRLNTCMQCLEDKHCKKKKKAGKYCISGKCQKSLLPVGASCERSQDCKSGMCIVGTCDDSLHDKNEKCRVNDDCKPPYICKSSICS